LKVSIVGCGAMGSVYAGLLAAAGHEVWAVDTWREHVDAIRKNGLRLEGASGDRTVRIRATTEAKDAGPSDLVILATKAMQVRDAAVSIQKYLLEDETPVLSIQNGLGGPDTAASVLGRERVLVGVVGGFGASMRAPGHAHHDGMELVRLGELSGGAVTPRLERVADLWRGAGFTVKAFADIDQLVWEKLICNCAYSGPCGLSGLTVGQVMADPDLSKVSAVCAAEAFAVAIAKKIKLEIKDPIAYVREFGAKIPNAKTSVLLDLLARRCTEIDVINGAIPREAAGVGLDAPVNEAVAALVRARERQLGCL
jgi:2-dehydropantoate 2-reductase